ncbi:MAG: gluconate 5-dehydrogenase [Betaproteobacteria bacterium RIFCSPLOWO2_12_FULL_62_58]|nr:MAG: gluconate 5-dehydrogenase [Betaproteobacteria bacterium RIFCSPLOWO2_12_FULL_62_58]
MASVKELFDLSGRVSVITGGATGLGLQMATALAEAGSNIVVCSRKLENCEAAAHQLEKLGAQALAVACDVTKPDQVEAMKEATLKKFARVDVLVNNAGRAWSAPPEEMPLERWQQVFDLNITAPFLCAQSIGREMIKKKRGKIINIASVAGLVGRNPRNYNSVAYSASKGALVNFTRDLAVKWAQYNIQVNCICPGFFVTPLNQELYERNKENIDRDIPLGRTGGPDDLKGLAVLLASDASDFMTGAIIPVDGGALAW